MLDMDTQMEAILVWLIEETEHFSSRLPVSGFFLVENSEGSGEHHKAELPRGQQCRCESLQVFGLYVVPGRDHATLVDAAQQLHHDFVGSVVVYYLELSDIPVPLHQRQEVNDHLRYRADENLALAAFLCVDDGLQAVRQDVHTHHDYS